MKNKTKNKKRKIYLEQACESRYFLYKKSNKLNKIPFWMTNKNRIFSIVALVGVLVKRLERTRMRRRQTQQQKKAYKICNWHSFDCNRKIFVSYQFGSLSLSLSFSFSLLSLQSFTYFFNSFNSMNKIAKI